MESRSVAAALKKIAVSLLTDPKVLKAVSGVVIGVIVIIVMPIVATIAVFNSDIKIDTDRLQQKVVENLSAEEQKSYAQQLTGNLEDLNAENEIETLVKAKGFADCLCFLQSGRADLTVMTSGDALTAAQVAQIRDIVLSKSSVTAQNITVVEVK